MDDRKEGYCFVNKPHPNDFASIPDRIDEREYPLRNLDEFAEALGGWRKPLRLQGRSFPLYKIRPFVHPNYFPVNSREDLVAKLAHFQLQFTSETPVPPPGVVWGTMTHAAKTGGGQ